MLDLDIFNWIQGICNSLIDTCLAKHINVHVFWKTKYN